MNELNTYIIKSECYVVYSFIEIVMCEKYLRFNIRQT